MILNSGISILNYILVILNGSLILHLSATLNGSLSILYDSLTYFLSVILIGSIRIPSHSINILNHSLALPLSATLNHSLISNHSISILRYNLILILLATLTQSLTCTIIFILYSYFTRIRGSIYLPSSSS